MTFKEKCLERTERLLNFSVDTNLTFSVLKMLHQLRREKPDIHNLSPAFYGSIFNNSIHVLMTEIPKMFDDKEKHEKDTESTYFLLKKMRDNLNLLEDISLSVNQFSHISYEDVYYIDFKTTQEMLDYYLDSIEQKKEIINHITKRRHKYYAHWDQKSINDINKLFVNNPVSLNDVEEVLVLNSNICVALYRYFYRDRIYSPLVDNREDFLNTVNYLEAHIKELEQEND